MFAQELLQSQVATLMATMAEQQQMEHSVSSANDAESQQWLYNRGIWHPVGGILADVVTVFRQRRATDSGIESGNSKGHAANNVAVDCLGLRDRQGGGPRVVVSTAAFHARVRGSVPGLGGLKETKMFLPHPRVKVSIVGSLRDREVACSASDRQGSNFESCVWRTVSSQSSHHPQEVLLAQFSLYVHKGGLKPDSFHFFERPPAAMMSVFAWPRWAAGRCQ